MRILLQRELHHLIRGLSYQILGMRFTKVYIRDEINNRRSQKILKLADENFRKGSMRSRNEEILPMDQVYL